MRPTDDIFGSPRSRLSVPIENESTSLLILCPLPQVGRGCWSYSKPAIYLHLPLAETPSTRRSQREKET